MNFKSSEKRRKENHKLIKNCWKRENWGKKNKRRKKKKKERGKKRNSQKDDSRRKGFLRKRKQRPWKEKPSQTWRRWRKLKSSKGKGKSLWRSSRWILCHGWQSQVTNLGPLKTRKSGSKVQRQNRWIVVLWKSWLPMKSDISWYCVWFVQWKIINFRAGIQTKVRGPEHRSKPIFLSHFWKTGSLAPSPYLSYPTSRGCFQGFQSSKRKQGT